MRSTGERRSVPRALRTSLALVVLLLLLPLATSQAAASTGQWRVPGPTTKLYIGQSARLTAQIPANWTVTPANDHDYAGTDGFVRSMPLAASNLHDACTKASGTVPRTTVAKTRWHDRPACVINAPGNESSGDPAATALVVAHPHPFTSFGTTYGYVALVADAAHFPGIVATLSFDSARVTPLAYTRSVIDLAEARSLFSTDVDWPRIRLAAATTVTDWDSAHATVDLLINMLRAAGDNHSLYLSPTSNANFSDTRQELPSARHMTGGIGYVQLTGVWPSPDAVQNYVRTTRSLIASIERSPTCGWIVDLRRNDGGDVYPMVQGVSPLLGDGRIFGFRYGDGRQDWVSLKDGAVLYNGVRIVSPVNDRVGRTADHARQPVAVLIGPGTASSGEAIAIAFIGRPDSRLFGASTAGFTTGNKAFQLLDGHTLLLAGVYDTDRNGTVYTHGVTPDETIDAVGEFGTEADPTIVAAKTWLSQQPACQSMNPAATPAA